MLRLQAAGKGLLLSLPLLQSSVSLSLYLPLPCQLLVCHSRFSFLSVSLSLCSFPYLSPSLSASLSPYLSPCHSLLAFLSASLLAARPVFLPAILCLPHPLTLFCFSFSSPSLLPSPTLLLFPFFSPFCSAHSTLIISAMLPTPLVTTSNLHTQFHCCRRICPLSYCSQFP